MIEFSTAFGKKFTIGKNYLHDFSLWFLVLSNICILILASIEHWSLQMVMWTYWWQSVIIGGVNFFRILQLKSFTTEGFTINDQPATTTKKTQVFTAWFFLLHYGAFHAIYLIFLIIGEFSSNNEWWNVSYLRSILIGVGIFLLTHVFSYLYNRRRDKQVYNIGKLMFFPYLRIIPMHLTLLFGLFFPRATLYFLILKTLADCAMHIVEHNIVEKKYS